MANDPNYSRYAAAKTAAAKKGQVVVVPAANELFVDLDDASDLETYEKNLPRVREYFDKIGDVGVWKRPSPSGRRGRYHVTVTLPRDVESPYERIMLQLILGSDPVRECLSWGRANEGDPVPTLFFAPAAAEPDPEAGTDLATPPNEELTF